MTEKIIPVNEPKMDKKTNGYLFKFEDLLIEAELNHLTDKGEGELIVTHKNGCNRLLLHKTVNLLSMNSCSLVSKQLFKSFEEHIDFDTALTYLTHMALEDMRKEQPLEQIGTQPESMEIKYLLYPLLEENKPTTIFGQGGSVKSYIADLISIATQTGIPVLEGQWKPFKGNVLYLDWETEKEDHMRRVWAIKKGLIRQGVNVGLEDTFLYRRCERPFVDEVESIKRQKEKYNIALIIIDSHMAAQGYGQYGLSESQLNSMMYNSIRYVGCTFLSIDHIDKASLRGISESVGPIGTVVKFNRSRAQFELSKQDSGDDYVEVVMKHKKRNEGRLIKDMAIRVDFYEPSPNILEWVTFSKCDIKEKPTINNRKTSCKQAMKAALEEGGLMSIEELSKATGYQIENIRTELSRGKRTFKEKDGMIALIDRRYKRDG